MTPLRIAGLLTLLVSLTAGTACASAADRQRERNLIATSGIAPERVEHYLDRLDQLGNLAARHLAAAPPAAQAETLHRFLHTHVLRGSYLASASDVGVALDGGSFNCVSATLVMCLLAERCGLEAWAMSTPGHVWTRVSQAGREVDVETTNPRWFYFAEKYRGVPTSLVSPAMARHRERIASGRRLDDRRLLAVLHFNRGVTLIREKRLGPAAWANLQALALDRECVPALENLVAVNRRLARHSFSGGFTSVLIRRQIELAVARSTSPLAAGNALTGKISGEFATE